MFSKLFDPNKKELKKLESIALNVIELEETYASYSDDDLKGMTDKFKERIEDGETLDDILVEAFAVVREASKRLLNMTPYKVQLMGGIAIHQGNISEMKTGEGKTLTAVLPAYLNALTGNGVHIVTVNEYLAAREAEGEIGDLFRWLNLTVGLNARQLTKDEKRQAYLCDILYSTNNELGFDYLRDHMVIFKEEMVQRPLNFAIIDEVDSILIDEARTPLIISGGSKNTANLYVQANTFAKSLREEDYEIDIKTKSINLTEVGISKAERAFGIQNLYDLDSVHLVHNINNAMKANYTMEADVDYVVQDGKVIIVDSFTGRLMHGRQFNEGLHQALEAKEGVKVKKETSVLATITFQNFFRMYHKLSGMTGTAKTEEEEFRSIYNMIVVEIPTNRPIVRDDMNDLIFATMEAKYKYIAKEIAMRHKTGQPILIGTVSIESSELLSDLLKKEHIPHDVLNAKQHEREAEIVENAGKKGSVTIATNMAGRGTDIKLGDGVTELGGLAVLGTERHESRRIDNQLRGRSGRQGDPGYTRFYLSGDDDLVRRFGGERFKNQVARLTKTTGSDLESPLDYGMFSNIVKRAQKQIEGNNFDRRKTVLQYDEVLRKQREVIYQQRSDVLFLDDIEPIVVDMVLGTLQSYVDKHTNYSSKNMEVNTEDLLSEISGDIYDKNHLEGISLKGTNEEIFNILEEIFRKELEEKREHISNEKFSEFLKVIVLRVVDTYWVQHIDRMSELRQSIRLQSYAQMNPLREYQEVGYNMFNELISNINKDVTKYIIRGQIRDNLQREQVAKPTSTHSGKEDQNRKKQPRRVEKTVGRNDPCPCGSGKKYKQCCGK